MDNYANLRAQVNQYVKKYPTLSAKQNKELFIKLVLLREDLPTNLSEYNTIREKLIISNGAFAMKYAILYCKKLNDGELIEDLFQQAQIGIIEAVDRFNPTRGVNFTTFAFFYIRKCIIDYIKRNKVISVNRNIARYIKHISDTYDQLLVENEGYIPQVSEIQEFLKVEKNIDVKSDVIVQLLNLIELNSSSSELSFTTDNFDNIPFEEKYENLLLLQINLLNEFTDVSKEHLDIIKLRFGIGYDRPYTLEEIKFLKKLSDLEIREAIEVSHLYIPF